MGFNRNIIYYFNIFTERDHEHKLGGGGWESGSGSAKIIIAHGEIVSG